MIVEFQQNRIISGRRTGREKQLIPHSRNSSFIINFIWAHAVVEINRRIIHQLRQPFHSIPVYLTTGEIDDYVVMNENGFFYQLCKVFCLNHLHNGYAEKQNRNSFNPILHHTPAHFLSWIPLLSRSHQMCYYNEEYTYLYIYFHNTMLILFTVTTPSCFYAACSII